MDREVGLERVDVAMTERRRPQLDPFGVREVQVLGGVAEQAAPVGRVVQVGCVSVPSEAAAMSAISALTSAWPPAVDDVGHIRDGTTPSGVIAAPAFH